MSTQTPVTWSVHVFTTQPDTLSGPDAFRGFTLLKDLLVLALVTEIAIALGAMGGPRRHISVLPIVAQIKHIELMPCCCTALSPGFVL